jgi:hypothetical protein
MKTITMPGADGKELKFRGLVSILNDELMGFSLYNDCADKWEAAHMRIGCGNENYMPDVIASGLVFNRTSSRAITEVLKHIVAELEKYNEAP